MNDKLKVVGDMKKKPEPAELTDEELLRHCASDRLISWPTIVAMHDRLMTKPVKDLSNLELHAIEVLNKQGVGVSGLIKAHFELLAGDK